MAKTTAPLLSFGASGQVAKTQVYAKWRGRPYVRRHVVPSNPQTAEQSLTRNTFSWLQQVYKFAPAIFTAPWEAYIQGKVMTSRNAFTKFNLGPLRPETDLAEFIASPGVLGGIPGATLTLTPGDDLVTIAGTAPAVIPDGWTLVGLQGIAIRDQDPATGTFYTMASGEDLTSAYSFQLTGLTSAVDYLAAGWWKWTRPDGRTAYSPSVQEIVTTT